MIVDAYSDVTESGITRSWDAAAGVDTNRSSGGVFESEVCVGQLGYR